MILQQGIMWLILLCLLMLCRIGYLLEKILKHLKPKQDE